jgi:uncharacterized BrkB/YihY/UPF0761 family membrane protein
MWVFLSKGAYTIYFTKIKFLIKNLFSERTSTIIGNLSYLSILALAPTIIITTSLLNILSNYFHLSNIPSFIKIYSISQTLNLNQTTSLAINIICINLLSSGIFSLLSTFENLYKFKFKNYLRKKLYSLALSLILILAIISIITLTFLLAKYNFFQKVDFIITLLAIFLSILTFYKFSTFQKLKHLYSGALISAFFLTIFLNFFYYIINNFSDLSSYYGLLSPIIITILLIYYSGYIIYFGILINIEFSKKKNKIIK